MIGFVDAQRLTVRCDTSVMELPRWRQHLSCCDDRVQRRGLTCSCGIVWLEGSGPHLSKLVVRSLVLGPDAVGVCASELDVPLIGEGVVQGHEIAKKDALELNAVSAAIWLARVMQNAVRVAQMVDRRQRDVLCRLRQRAVRILLVELDEASKDDTLIVGPRGSVIVLAVGVQPIVEQIL